MKPDPKAETGYKVAVIKQSIDVFQGGKITFGFKINVIVILALYQ
jgi:hypothetical protein